MRRIVLALESLKGSIAAADAVAEIASGWRSVDPLVGTDLRPMADGGEGTLAAFAEAVAGATRIPVAVTGPHGRSVDASWLRLPDGTGVVELASTSGIELLGDDRRPWDAGTIGFGQAIAAALDADVQRLVLGIGSSASTDGGAGMLSAIGARILNGSGEPIGPGARGLRDATSVDLSGIRPLPSGGVVVLSDVTSPLIGPHGAAAVFGPQKGLDAADVEAANAALARFADLVIAARSGVPVSAGARRANTVPLGLHTEIPGAGAAGGTGFALLAWGAALRPGAAEVADLVGLRAAIARADLVVTGEGSFDGQSAAGKVPTLVAGLADAAGVPVALVAGRIARDADTSAFAASVSLTQLAGSAASSLAEPARWLRAAGAALARNL